MERIKEFKVEHEAFNKLGLGQPRELYAIITDSGDCMINGWLEVNDIVECEMLKTKSIKLEAALCTADNAIIDRQQSFRTVNQAVELGYSAFSIFMAGVNRYTKLEDRDIEYVKIYPVFDE